MKNQDFLLVDHTIQNINQISGAVLLSSPVAWQKYNWTRKLFNNKPEEGYFLWLKKSQPKPLTSCISLETGGTKQSLINLIVVDSQVKLKIMAVCNALKENLTGQHKGISKIFIKQKGELEIIHQHSWGKQDLVWSQIDFHLQAGAKIKYNYYNFKPAKKLEINNKIFLADKAKGNFFLGAEANQSSIKINESLFLEGKDSKGSLFLRLVGRKKSLIKASSKIIASQAGRGHLDCQGLLVGRQAKIDLIPQLTNKNKQALITHEASIGRIEKDKLEYLQSRGLSEKKATNLIVQGFFHLEKLPLTNKGSLA